MAGAPAEYRFVDRWRVPAPIERVYDILGDVKGYPTWWHEAFLSAEGDDGPPVPGRRISVVSRGYLPYRLRWSLTVTEAERPTRIASRLEGDFEGEGTWLFEPDGEGTSAVLDWRPRVTQPFVRTFTPILRPFFRSNHFWAMRRGQKGIVALLASTPPEGEGPRPDQQPT